MNEMEWLSHHDPAPLLHFLRGRPNLDRKLRLFAVACCMEFAGEFPGAYYGAYYNEALESAERFADSIDDDDDNRFKSFWSLVADAESAPSQRERSIAEAVNLSTYFAKPIPFRDRGEMDIFGMAEQVSRLLVDASQSPDRIRNSYALRAAERLHQANLIRDLFGNPFRPAALDPRWLISTVSDLSRAIYQERAFERMPILADALMDAGCDSDEMLAHCRGAGPHARGCWLIDLLLAKG
jgi:hypothetical protein